MNKGKKNVLLLLFFIAVILYFGYTFMGQHQAMSDRYRDLKVIETKIEEEKIYKNKLIQEKDTIHTDEYVEKVAREKLGMVKQGEMVFIDINK